LAFYRANLRAVREEVYDLGAETMNELPKECALPRGVDWCELVGRCHWIAISNDVPDVPWPQLSLRDKCYVAARCAMWWGSQPATKTKYEAFDAWRKLWRELEGMR